MCLLKKSYEIYVIFDGYDARTAPLYIKSLITDLTTFNGRVSIFSKKIKIMDITININKENLCCVPFFKNADLIAIPTSSRFDSIIQ